MSLSVAASLIAYCSAGTPWPGTAPFCEGEGIETRAWHEPLRFVGAWGLNDARRLALFDRLTEMEAMNRIGQRARRQIGILERRLERRDRELHIARRDQEALAEQRDYLFRLVESFLSQQPKREPEPKPAPPRRPLYEPKPLLTPEMAAWAQTEPPDPAAYDRTMHEERETAAEPDPFEDRLDALLRSHGLQRPKPGAS